MLIYKVFSLNNIINNTILGLEQLQIDTTLSIDFLVIFKMYY